MTSAIENSLKIENYPDSTLDVSVTIICDDGGLKTCAINATILALLDAGFAMKNLVASSNIVVKGNSFNYDPSLVEEEFADGVATFVYDIKSETIFSTFIEGNFTPEQIHEVLDRAKYNLPFWKQTFENLTK